MELGMPQMLIKSTLWLKYVHFIRLPLLNVQAGLKKARLKPCQQSAKF